MVRITSRSRGGAPRSAAVGFLLVLVLIAQPTPAATPVRVTGNPSSASVPVGHTDCTSSGLTVPPTCEPRASTPGYIIQAPRPAGSTAAWTNATVPGEPTGRAYAAAAYYPPTKSTILFGGAGQLGTPYWSNETWSFDGSSWTNLSSTAGNAPPPQQGMLMAYDQADGYLVAWGGVGVPENPGVCTVGVFSPCNATWIFQNQRWFQLATTTAPPWDFCPSCASMTYDPMLQEVLLWFDAGPFASSPARLWTFAQGTWTEVIPTGIEPSGPGALVYDSVLKADILYVPSDESTWNYSGGSWSNLTSSLTGSPTARLTPQMIYDTASGNVVLFGGVRTVSSQVQFAANDTWLFNGQSWSNSTFGPSPGGRDEAAMVFDPQLNVTLITGGIWGNGTAGGGWNTTWMLGATPPPLYAAISVQYVSPDAGVAENFTAEFVGGTSPWTYSWSFGDTGFSTQSSPSHVYGSPGIYAVSVLATDALGRGVDATLQLPVQFPPALTIGASPNPTDVGTPVSLVGASQNGSGATTFSWNFGDGATGTGPSTAHTYAKLGTYNLSLTANDSGGGRANTSLVEVVNSPLGAPTLQAVPLNPALGQLVNFSTVESGGTPAYVFSWAFGDGGIGGNLANISHIFTTNGPFNVTVSVRDQAGAVSSQTIALVIRLNLTVLSNATLGAAPLPVSLSSQVQGGIADYAYAWTVSDGSVGQANSLDHTFASPGTYQVSLMVHDRSGQTVSQGLIIVTTPGGGPLSATLSATPANPVVGQTAQLTLTASGGHGRYTVAWRALPLGCTEVSPVTMSCNLTANGTYAPSVLVQDASGSYVVASTSLSVGQPSSPSQPFLSFPILGGVGALAAGVAVVVLVLATRRGSRGSGTRTLNSPSVSAGATKGTSSGEPSAPMSPPQHAPDSRSAGETDTLDDVF